MLPEIEDKSKRHPRASTTEHVDFPKKEPSRSSAAAVYCLKRAED